MAFQAARGHRMHPPDQDTLVIPKQTAKFPVDCALLYAVWDLPESVSAYFLNSFPPLPPSYPPAQACDPCNY